MALTRRDLDGHRCQNPDCGNPECGDGTVYFHGRCHPESPAWTSYSNGQVAVRCAECDGLVVEIRVADGPPGPSAAAH